MQPEFRYGTGVAAIALFAATFAASRILAGLPDRKDEPAATLVLSVYPIALPAGALAPLRLTGAWEVSADNPRVGGVSGLAIDGDQLVALTDRGSVLRFGKRPRPRMIIDIGDLPAGPSDGRFRFDRDTEALSRDPHGRGWWVAFEYHHQLWLYDAQVERSLGHWQVPTAGLTANTGIEGLAVDGESVLAFPERGGLVLRRESGRWTTEALDSKTRISDAVPIGKGRYFLLERRIGLNGFENSLGLAERDGDALSVTWRKRLPVSWRDNMEALAAEPLPGGGYRVWTVSDDNFHPRLRTVLLVIDVPSAALPKRD